MNPNDLPTNPPEDTPLVWWPILNRAHGTAIDIAGHVLALEDDLALLNCDTAPLYVDIAADAAREALATATQELQAAFVAINNAWQHARDKHPTETVRLTLAASFGGAA